MGRVSALRVVKKKNFHANVLIARHFMNISWDCLCLSRLSSAILSLVIKSVTERINNSDNFSMY